MRNGQLRPLTMPPAGSEHLARIENTQFLICDKPDDFWKNVPRRLAHVPPETIQRFAELQPWSTPPCKWTAKLRDLSNPDKHRALANLRSVTRVVPGDDPEISELLPGVEPRSDLGHLVVQVFFADTGDDVIDTLVDLQREVRALIAEFKPQFEIVTVSPPSG